MLPTDPRSGSPPPRRPWIATACLVLALIAGVVEGQRSPGADGDGEVVSSTLSVTGGLPTEIPLGRSVQRNLALIQDRWIEWTGVFLKNQPELSESLVTGLLQSARRLGLERLPDLSVAASGWALEAAIRDGDATRAEWALKAAEQFDPGRPETALARARVRWHQGRTLAALWSELEGYIRIVGTSPGDTLARANLVLWLLFTLLAAGGLFVALQMAVKGRGVFADLEAFLGRLVGLPAMLLRVLVVFLLLWPLLLPGGVLWLLLYWSALLIAYGSLTERAVIFLSWVLLVLAPLGVAHERAQTRLALSPATRGLEAVVENRLHGSLFQDLEQLAGLLPDDPAVIQLMADLHRGMGQWETALELYERVVELEPDNAWAWIDIGGYYFSKKDYGSAGNRFKQALEHAEDPEEKVVAHYNLSQAYQDQFLLEDAQRELQLAQEIDAGMVSRLQQQTVRERMATFDGGMARAPEIRRRLAGRLLGPEDPGPAGPGEDGDGAERDGGGGDDPTGERSDAASRGDRSDADGWLLGHAAGVLGAGALAILFWILRPGVAVPVSPSDGRPGMWEGLVPGLASAREGKGFRAFAALLIPLALLTLPLLDDLAYPMFAAYGDGAPALLILAATGLVLYFGIRLGMARLG